jgi:hypothetical protein
VKAERKRGKKLKFSRRIFNIKIETYSEQQLSGISPFRSAQSRNKNED